MSAPVVPMEEPRLVAWLADVLARAGLIVFPTDTVYGLGGDPWNLRAVERAQALKGRGADQPLTLHLVAVADVDAVARLDARTRGILAHFLPGPYTFLVPANDTTPSSAVRDGKVGVRVPNHPFFRETLRRVGTPLFGTSVNRAGRPPLGTLEEIAHAFPGIDLLVSSPEAGTGTPSAVVDLTTTPPRALRGEVPPGLT